MKNDFLIPAEKITCGVYKYNFARPLTTSPDYRGNTTTYVSCATCGVPPQVVYDALYPAHNKVVEDPNVIVFSDNGNTTTTRLSRLLDFINGKRYTL